MIRALVVMFALALPSIALAQPKIVIDAGHGGADPGGVGTGMQEKNVVLDVSKRFKQLLDADTADNAGGGKWTTLMTRSTDVFVSLAGRSAYSNDNGADRFMCIHSNAFSDPAANGTETFSYTDTGTAAQLRNLVQDEMIKAWKLTNRGNKTENFAVLRDTAAPAELHEMAFITNATDAAHLASGPERQRAAEAHLKAIQRHYNIPPYVPGNTMPPQDEASEIAGHVTDDAGPIAGATVKLDDGTSVVTDKDGAFLFTSAAAGDHVLSASADHHKSAMVDVTVAAMARADVDIVLERGEPSSQSGGCSTSSGARWLLLLALLGLRRRPRPTRSPRVRAKRAASLALLALLAACTFDEATDETRVAETAQPITVCADGPTTYGIDVSRFQGDINWPMVASSGVKYAWIQISRSLTDIDLKFPYNWQHAKAAGILRGAYQRFHPGMDVMGQAKLFVDKLQPVFELGDMPPMLDVEDADGLTAAQISAAVNQWMQYVEPRIGLKPIIYTGYYFWRDSVASADLSAHPLWIANYSATCPLVPDHWTRWAFHQYSSTVNVPGITANTCDVDKFNGTLDDLKALAAQPSCGDNTCNGTETTESCAADCAPCHVIDDGADAVVDDASACFTAGGDPQFIRKENAGYGSSLQWTNATDNATPANFGRWELYFANAGTYKVEANTPAPYNGSKQTVYQVHHADGVTAVTIDQSSVDGWNPIGEFAFATGGNGQFIRLDDNTGEPNTTQTKIVFDALRFTKITDTPGDSGGDPPGMGGGCSTTGGAPLGLAFAALLLRRRRAKAT